MRTAPDADVVARDDQLELVVLGILDLDVGESADV